MTIAQPQNPAFSLAAVPSPLPNTSLILQPGGATSFDINFFGHHVVAHLSAHETGVANGVIDSDGDTAPLRHFGVILPLEDWKEMERRLTSRNVEFILSPRLSFAGKPAEQHIMMLPDGCGNIVEFKSQPPEQVFSTDPP